MKPLLLLDIDGVLCPFGGDPEKYKPLVGHEFASFAPIHTTWLHELGGYFDLVWASFWVRDREILSTAHELGELPSVEFTNENCFGRGNWKTDTIKLLAIEEHAEDRPLVWIDDDIRQDGFDWAEKRNETIPTKFILTNPTIGMDEEVMAELRKFVKSLN